MLLELVPLLLLFEVSIWVARGVERGRDAEDARARRRRRRGVSTLFAADWVVPVSSAPLARRRGAGGGGADRGGRRRRPSWRRRTPAPSRVDLPGCVLAPGFVNLHSHIEYAAYSGLGDGLAFGPWITAHTRRTAAARARGPRRDGAARRGRVPALGRDDARRRGLRRRGGARPARAAGLRAVVAIEAFGGDDADVAARRGRARAPRRRARGRGGAARRARGLAARALHGRPGALRRDRRARPRARHARRHAPRRVAPRARRADRRHGRADALRSRPSAATRSSSSPSAGCSGPRRSSPTRCTWATRRSPRSRRAGAAVAHCPRSNALLGCGVAPLAKLRAAGVRVGLGTDSPSSALSLDMFDELRAALLLARASAGDPEALSTAAALQLATLDGARALGLDDRGALAPGLLADLVAVRLDRTPFWPCDDPASALVLGGSPASRDAGRDRRQRAVRCGFDRIRARAPRRGGCALPPSRPQRRNPHDHLSPMIIWIRNRKGWIGGVFFVLAAHLRAVVHDRRRRHGQQRLALRHLRQQRRQRRLDDAAAARASARCRRRSRPSPRMRRPGSSSRTPTRARPARPTRPAPGSTTSRSSPATSTALQRLALAQAQVATNLSNQAQS